MLCGIIGVLQKERIYFRSDGGRVREPSTARVNFGSTRSYEELSLLGPTQVEEHKIELTASPALLHPHDESWQRE